MASAVGSQGLVAQCQLSSTATALDSHRQASLSAAARDRSGRRILHVLWDAAISAIASSESLWLAPAAVDLGCPAPPLLQLLLLLLDLLSVKPVLHIVWTGPTPDSGGLPTVASVCSTLGAVGCGVLLLLSSPPDCSASAAA